MDRLVSEHQRCVAIREQLRTRLAEASAAGDAERVAAIVEAEAEASVQVYLAEKRIATYERGVRGLICDYRGRVAKP